MKIPDGYQFLDSNDITEAFGNSYQDPFSDFQEEAQLNIGNKPADLLEQTKEYCIMPWRNKQRKFIDQKHATEYDVENYTEVYMRSPVLLKAYMKKVSFLSFPKVKNSHLWHAGVGMVNFYVQSEWLKSDFSLFLLTMRRNYF